jgi:arylsulfatase A-like enzyme
MIFCEGITFVYEEKMRVPLMVSAPGLVPPGVVTNAMSSNVDVMPTLLSLAGIKERPYSAGIDLTPALIPELNGPDAALRDHVILHHDSEVRTPTTIGGQAPSNFKHPTHIRCLRDGQWKYAYYFRPGQDLVEPELYNLMDDPWELDNLAHDSGYASKRAEMHERLVEEDGSLARDWGRR